MGLTWSLASVFLTIIVLLNFVNSTCLFSSTGETLSDCQWSRWCWDCSSCGKPGDSGQVLLLRGTCCAAPNDDPADCATHCGIPMTTDFNMTTFSTCAVKCGNKSDPSICKGIDDTSSGSGTTTTSTKTPTAATTSTKSPPTATIKPPPSTSSISHVSKSTVITSSPGSAITSPQSSSSGGSVGPIAGGAAGGVIVLAVILALLIYMLKCRKAQVDVEHENPKEKLDDNGESGEHTQA